MDHPKRPRRVEYDGYDLETAKASVGKGWHPLLECLFSYLKNNEKNPKLLDTRIVQVKEKFGGLRIYAHACPDYTQGIITGLELASEHICEDCGNAGSIRGSRAGRTWIRTLCNSCHEPAQPTHP